MPNSFFIRLAAAVSMIAPAVAQSSPALKPATVTEIVRRYDKTGKLKSETRFLYAINGKGSTVVIDVSPTASGIRQILEPSQGRNIVVNPKTKTALISGSRKPFQLATDCRQEVRGPVAVTITTEPAGGTIHGLPVQKVILKFANGDSSDLYKAPSLGCHTLRSVVHQKGRPPREEQTAVEVKLGEPDPALFAIPKGFQVRDQP